MARRVPLRTAVRNNARVVEKHKPPTEVKPVDLGFQSVNSMYCIGNDDLMTTFQKALVEGHANVTAWTPSWFPVSQGEPLLNLLLKN